MSDAPPAPAQAMGLTRVFIVKNRAPRWVVPTVVTVGVVLLLSLVGVSVALGLQRKKK